MFDIKLIGVNEYASEKATIAELSALDGYVTHDYTVPNLGLVPEYEADNVKFSDGSVKDYGKLQKKGKLIFYPMVYNDITTAATFNTIFTVADVLECDYYYLYSEDYNVQFATEEKALNLEEVNLTTETDKDDQIKKLILDYTLNSGI